MLGSQIAIELADRRIDLEDIKTGEYSEVAIIYDICKKIERVKCV